MVVEISDHRQMVAIRDSEQMLEVRSHISKEFLGVLLDNPFNLHEMHFWFVEI